MRTIIAGSRTVTDYAVVDRAIRQSGFEITQVISGTAGGVDRLGELWARRNRVPLVQIPAEWNKGKKAGYLRNCAMAEVADALVAVWDGQSRGTNHMLKIAKDKGLKTCLVICKPSDNTPPPSP